MCAGWWSMIKQCAASRVWIDTKLVIVLRIALRDHYRWSFIDGADCIRLGSKLGP